MTKEEQKAKAVELIEKWVQFAYQCGATKDNIAMDDIFKAAILECMSNINELKLAKIWYERDDYFSDRIDDYKGVIKAIEQQ